MSSLKDTLAPINIEVNGCRTPSTLSSHGLIEVHCYSRIKELPWSHKALEMVLWSSPNESGSSSYYCMTSKSKYSLEWNGLAL